MRLLILAILATSQASNSSDVSMNVDTIFDQMRSGKKFSEIVDARTMRDKFPETEALMEFLDNIEFSKDSCYTKIIRQLNVDCSNTSDFMQKTVAMGFTECYYEITGREHKIPAAKTDIEKLEKMDNATYITYQTMKLHWINLCRFAHQSFFNEETTKHLIFLFQSIIDSTDAMKSMHGAVHGASSVFDGSVESLQEKVDQGNKVLDDIRDKFLPINLNFNETFGMIMKPLEHIESFRIFLLISILTFLIGMFMPEILFPAITLLITSCVGDYMVGRRFPEWYNSLYRTAFKIIVGGLAVSYPTFKVARLVNAARHIFMHILGTRKQPVVAIPRFGGVKKRVSPKKPRAS